MYFQNLSNFSNEKNSFKNFSLFKNNNNNNNPFGQPFKVPKFGEKAEIVPIISDKNLNEKTKVVNPTFSQELNDLGFSNLTLFSQKYDDNKNENKQSFGGTIPNPEELIKEIKNYKTKCDEQVMNLEIKMKSYKTTIKQLESKIVELEAKNSENLVSKINLNTIMKTKNKFDDRNNIHSHNVINITSIDASKTLNVVNDIRNNLKMENEILKATKQQMKLEYLHDLKVFEDKIIEHYESLEKDMNDCSIAEIRDIMDEFKNYLDFDELKKLGYLIDQECVEVNKACDLWNKISDDLKFIIQKLHTEEVTLNNISHKLEEYAKRIPVNDNQIQEIQNIMVKICEDLQIDIKIEKKSVIDLIPTVFEKISSKIQDKKSDNQLIEIKEMIVKQLEEIKSSREFLHDPNKNSQSEVIEELQRKLDEKDKTIATQKNQIEKYEKEVQQPISTDQSDENTMIEDDSIDENHEKTSQLSNAKMISTSEKTSPIKKNKRVRFDLPDLGSAEELEKSSYVVLGQKKYARKSEPKSLASNKKIELRRSVIKKQLPIMDSSPEYDSSFASYDNTQKGQTRLSFSDKLSSTEYDCIIQSQKRSRVIERNDFSSTKLADPTDDIFNFP